MDRKGAKQKKERVWRNNKMDWIVAHSVASCSLITRPRDPAFCKDVKICWVLGQKFPHILWWRRVPD